MESVSLVVLLLLAVSLHKCWGNEDNYWEYRVKVLDPQDLKEMAKEYRERMQEADSALVCRPQDYSHASIKRHQYQPPYDNNRETPLTLQIVINNNTTLAVGGASLDRCSNQDTETDEEVRGSPPHEEAHTLGLPPTLERLYRSLLRAAALPPTN